MIRTTAILLALLTLPTPVKAADRKPIAQPGQTRDIWRLQKQISNNREKNY
jgi:hypothetical protein